MIFSASTGVFLSLLFNSNQISFGLGIGISVVIYAIQEIMMTYTYKIHNPQLWIYGLMFLSEVIICAYLLLDL